MAREPNRPADILEAVALLVVDMQDGLLNAIPGSAEVVERCAFAIEAAREFGLKIVFTEQVPDKLGPTHRALLARAPNARVFAKTAFSALQADGLLDHLRKQGIYHLLLAGIETPVCVYQTALHASDSDFDVTVLTDCVIGRRAGDCRTILEALGHANCHLLPAESVFYSMLGGSTHPRFRAFNAIVKRFGAAGALDAEPAAPEAPPPVEEPAPREPAREPRHREGRGRKRHEETPAATAPDEATVEPGSPPFPEAMEMPEPAEAAEADDSEAGPDDLPSTESAPGEPQRKRSRRRRGGVRRRRARERAAAAAQGAAPGEGNRDEAAPSRDDGAEEAPPQPPAGPGAGEARPSE